MATGGIFQLITNDGKQDRMLMATALLNKRLLEIERMRARNPQIKDPTPTLVDIERTHILFMNAHFKPFAAIGYEYNKVQVQSGAARLGAEVQYSIPQFGDFFNDMVLHLKLSSATATGAVEGNGFNEYLSYVDFLGQRLVKRVRFQVNGNPLDEYDSDVYNMHQKFFVTPNKQVGWNRAVGQEVPMRGYVNVAETVIAGDAGVREVRQFVDGPQTPKSVQPEIEMWVPLIFWFNKDPRLAIPSVSIPYGQRFIDVTFAAANEIMQHCGPSGSNPANNPITTDQAPTIDIADLYINNIFVNPEIHDIFIKRIGFSLIRVHRKQVIRTTKQNENLLLNQLKWPIETLYVGLRPVDNIDPLLGNATPGQCGKMLQSWHIYAQTDDVNVDLCSPNASLPDAWANNPAQPSMQEINDVLDQNRCQANYLKCNRLINRLAIEAHGVPLYRDIPASFFNHYVPYTYGGQHIKTPDDCGVHMITFNLYPGSYQPSGHVNVSRAREFYLQFQAFDGTVDSDNPADLVVVGIAINFLLISDGSAVLRYST
jgi:hypothetical protein